MDKSVGGNFGLNAGEFYYLSQLEEIIFLAIRKGKIQICDYLDLIHVFIYGSPNLVPLVPEDLATGITQEGAMQIVGMELILGVYLGSQGKGAGDYIKKLEEFLQSNGITVHKTSLK